MAIVRAFNPGSKAPGLLVLSGGAATSEALRVLAGEFYATDLPTDDLRVAAKQLRGHWVVELALDAVRRLRELRAVSAFAARRSDWVGRREYRGSHR